MKKKRGGKKKTENVKYNIYRKNNSIRINNKTKDK